MQTPNVIIIMGVAGSGKTTIGKQLAADLAYTFHDCDDLHSAANVEKMRSGTPLTDADRAPWLRSIRASIAAAYTSGENAIFACSALKAKYRLIMIDPDQPTTLVYLRGSAELIRSRLASRKDHFMGEALVSSQFEALEEPDEAITVSVDKGISDVVSEILERIGHAPSNG